MFTWGQHNRGGSGLGAPVVRGCAYRDGCRLPGRRQLWLLVDNIAWALLGKKY